MLLVGQMAAGIWTAPLNPDAGYYIPLARRVATGEVPFRDFPSLYPPGAYYLFSLLGSENLHRPWAIKAVLAAVHLVNVGLMTLLLRRHANCNPSLALCLAAVGGLWSLRAEGLAVGLEPWQNLYLLLALWGCLGGDRRGAIGAGLAAGLALLVKQYAVLSIPGLALVCLHRAGTGDSRQGTAGGRWSRPLWFLALAAAPFLAFAICTGQAPTPLLRQLASYGGEAASYGAAGFKSLYLNLLETNGPAMPLAAAGLLGGWLLFRKASWLHLGLVALLVGNMAPLYVRSFPHYVQMAIPWAVLVVAHWSWLAGRSEIAGDEPDDARSSVRRHALLAAAGLALVPVLVQGVAISAADVRRRPNLEQLALARALPSALAQVRGLSAADATVLRDVTVMNGEWLYALTDIVPPGGDYHFYDATHVARRKNDPPPLVVATAGRYPPTVLDGWARQLGLSLAYEETRADRRTTAGQAIPESWLRIYTRQRVTEPPPS